MRQLWPVLALCLGLRLGVALLHPVPPVADFAQYHNLALSWLTTGHFGLPDMEAKRTPGYPAFLAGIYALGGNVLWATIAQAFLGCFSCWLLWRLAGWIPALLFAISPSWVAYVPILASEHILLPLLLVAFALRGRPVLAGLTLGLAVLARPLALLFAPSVAGRGPKAWGFLAVGLVLALSPWLYRNVRAGYGPTLSTFSGFNLWMGNHDGATGGWDYDATWGGPNRGEGQTDRDMAAVGVRWIRGHPGDYLRLCAIRAWRLLGQADRTLEFYYPAGRLWAALRLAMLPAVVLGLLGIRRTPYLAGAVAYGLAVLATASQPRYFMALQPFVLLSLPRAWHGVLRGYQAVRSQRGQYGVDLHSHGAVLARPARVSDVSNGSPLRPDDLGSPHLQGLSGS